MDERPDPREPDILDPKVLVAELEKIIALTRVALAKMEAARATAGGGRGGARPRRRPREEP